LYFRTAPSGPLPKIPPRTKKVTLKVPEKEPIEEKDSTEAPEDKSSD